MRVGVIENKHYRELIAKAWGGAITVVPPNDTHDVLFVGSYSQLTGAEQHFHGQPMVNYLWDLYEWALTYPGYNYERYRKLLAQSTEIWTPSQCTTDRLKEFWGLDSYVVPCSVPFKKRPTRDDRFVLQPLRDIPDKWAGEVEKACAELGIPCVSPDHQRTREEFEDLLASCTFVVSGYYEASTGGLSAMEAYYLGKPVLASGSPYCGIRDYLGDRAIYFADLPELKDKLRDMWHNVPQVADDHQQYIEERFSEEAFGQRLERRWACVADKISSSG